MTNPTYEPTDWNALARETMAATRARLATERARLVTEQACDRALWDYDKGVAEDTIIDNLHTANPKGRAWRLVLSDTLLYHLGKGNVPWRREARDPASADDQIVRHAREFHNDVLRDENR